jgi:hypothetical protein
VVWRLGRRGPRVEERNGLDDLGSHLIRTLVWGLIHLDKLTKSMYDC